MPLVQLLLAQAQKRGLLANDLDDQSGATPELVFSLVRDMHYKRASSRNPEDVIGEWRGTCSGKHYLLSDLFEELGFKTRILMCPHFFTPQNTAHFPVGLRRQTLTGSIPDIHTFLRVEIADEWIDVDATWPLSASNLGFPVNPDLRPGVNMEIACEPIETLEIPEGMEAQAFKEQLIAAHCHGRQDQRDRFSEDMSGWLAESTSQ